MITVTIKLKSPEEGKNLRYFRPSYVIYRVYILTDLPGKLLLALFSGFPIGF